MNLISFDPLRTWDVPGVQALKAAEWERHVEALRAADWILFPEYWQVNALVYGLQRPIFPSVSSYHLGHNKVEMTRAFQMAAPRHVPYTRILPRTETAVALARRVAHTLNINHAGFDVALVEGRPYLLEFNMRFGNEALRQQGIRLGQRIYRYLEEKEEGIVPPFMT